MQDLVPSETPSVPAESPQPRKPTPTLIPLPGYEWVKDEAEWRTRIKNWTRRAYPSYRGRTFKLEFRESYFMQNYWDGGTRYYAMAVNLQTGQIAPPHADTSTPFNKAAGAEFDIPPGMGILELCIFCGKNLGVSLILSPRHVFRIAEREGT